MGQGKQLLNKVMSGAKKALKSKPKSKPVKRRIRKSVL